MTQLEVALLGVPLVYNNARPVNFRTRKTVALLAYLVVERRVHARESLAALLWPESAGAAGRASLRNTLLHLRRGLDHSGAMPDPLTVKRDTIALAADAPVALDVERIATAVESNEMAAMRAAASDVRGEFLAGFSLPDAPAFDDWTALQRERWHLVATELLARLSRLEMRRGDGRAALESVGRWLALDPLSEQAYRRLIRLRLGRGDLAGARHSYESCLRMLREELGVPPSEETRALGRQLETSLPPAAVPLDPVADRAPRPRFEFVGRNIEHARLVARFDAVRRGDTQVVILEGEAGIGKSRLAGEFLRWAATHGTIILSSKEFERGGRLPYRTIVELLRAPVALEHVARSAIPPVYLTEVARLLPDLAERLPSLPEPAHERTTARYNLNEGLFRIVSTLATSAPVVLFLDDVQWSDGSSRELVTYLAQRAATEHVPLFVLLAVRREALARIGGAPIDPGLVGWLAALERTLDANHLVLEPLPRDAIVEFASRMVASDDAATVGDWLYRETGGQPFFLVETVESLFERGILALTPDGDPPVELVARDELAGLAGLVAPGVRDLIRDRLGSLSPRAFELLAAGAVLGQDFAYRDLCAVAALDEAQELGALDELLAARLLVEQPDATLPYRFAHDRVRDVVYTEAGDARRRLLHRRALAYLEGQHASPDKLAHHALAAALPDPAFAYSVAEGEEAMRLFATRDAIEPLERARDLLEREPRLAEAIAPPERRRLFVRLGRAYELAGEWHAAGDQYETLLDHARDTSDPGSEIAALNRLGTLAMNHNLDAERAITLLTRASDLARQVDDQAGYARAEWGLGHAYFFTNRHEIAERHATRGLELARDLGDRDLQGRCHNLLSYLLHGPGPRERLDRMIAHATRAYELFKALGNVPLALDSHAMVGIGKLHRGDTRDGLEYLEYACRVSAERDNVWGVAAFNFSRAIGYLELGRLGEAARTVERSVEVAERLEHPNLILSGLQSRAMVYRALGRREAALDDSRRADELARGFPIETMHSVMAGQLCQSLASLGRWDEALGYARASLGSASPTIFFTGLEYWRVIETLLRAGERPTAREAIAWFAGRIGDNPRYRVVLLRMEALFAEDVGDPEGAVERLNAALDQATALGLLLQRLQLLERLAAQVPGPEAAALGDEAGALRRRLARSIEEERARERFLSSS